MVSTVLPTTGHTTYSRYFNEGQLRSDYKTVAKQDAQALVEVALLAATFIPMGRAVKLAHKGYRMYRGTKLFQVVRTVKRPITSTMTRLGYSSKPETAVRIYGIGKGLAGIADSLATTRALMRGEYGEVAVTFYGPPFAGHAYRRIKQSLASSSSSSQQNGGAKGNKKTSNGFRSPLSYTPKKIKWSNGYEYEECRRGYVLKRVNGKMKCVKCK